MEIGLRYALVGAKRRVFVSTGHSPSYTHLPTGEIIPQIKQRMILQGKRSFPVKLFVQLFLEKVGGFGRSPWFLGYFHIKSTESQWMIGGIL